MLLLGGENNFDITAVSGSDSVTRDPGSLPSWGASGWVAQFWGLACISAFAAAADALLGLLDSGWHALAPPGLGAGLLEAGWNDRSSACPPRPAQLCLGVPMTRDSRAGEFEDDVFPSKNVFPSCLALLIFINRIV